MGYTNHTSIASPSKITHNYTCSIFVYIAIYPNNKAINMAEVSRFPYSKGFYGV